MKSFAQGFATPALLLSLLLFSTTSFATTYTFVDCTSKNKEDIKDAVKWLKNNMSKIDKKMGKNGLKDWPGKSRKKFIAKLDKKLKFKCKKKDTKMYHRLL